MKPTEKVRWGILSTAKIGVEKVIPAMQQGQYAEIAAIASRNVSKAEQVAHSLGIDHAVGSYQQLLDRPDIDAIYNPLPNHLHVEWTLKALEAGKHVLCEKPIGLTAEEARQLLAASRKYSDLKVMEAFMFRHHPRWKRAKELVQQRAVGSVRTIRSFFSYFNDDPDNIRNKPDIGGGGLMDIGCYCISVPRFIFGQEPETVSGLMEYDPDMQIDSLTSGMLQFSAGTATFTCGTQLAPHQQVEIIGTEGRLTIPMPFNAPVDKPTSLLLTTDQQTEEITFPRCNQYTIQGDLFSKAILEDRQVPTPLDDALANMEVIEAIIASNKQGTEVQLPR